MNPLLAERLTSLRKANKKTQQQVSDYLGITRPAYTAYERGNRQPDYDILQKLADYYKVTTDYLLGRTESSKQAVDDDREEMRKYFSNPRLDVFFKEMAESKEEQLEELQEFWEIIKKRGLNKK